MLLSTRGQALGGGGDPGGSERDSCRPISAPLGGLSAGLGGWGQSGLRLEVQLSASPGAIAGPPTLTAPPGTGPSSTAQEPVENKEKFAWCWAPDGSLSEKNFRESTASVLFLSPLRQPLPTTPASYKLLFSRGSRKMGQTW